MAVTDDAMIEPKPNFSHLDRNLFIFFYRFTEPFCVITFFLRLISSFSYPDFITNHELFPDLRLFFIDFESQ